VGDVGPAENPGQPALHRTPIAPGLAQAVHFLPPQVVGHLYRIGAERPVQGSARLWAASVLSTSVRRPSMASRTAVAAATLVFPTPPLPVYTRMRMSPSRDYYEVEILGQKKLLFDRDTPKSGAGGRLLGRHLEGRPHLGDEGQELGLLLL